MKYIYPLFAILIVFFGCTSHQDEIIPDANLAAAIRKTLNLDPNTLIQKEKLKELTGLIAIKKNIKDLSGLEKRNRFNDINAFLQSNTRYNTTCTINEPHKYTA